MTNTPFCGISFVESFVDSAMMDEGEPPDQSHKKGGFKGKWAQWKFAHNLKKGTDKKDQYADPHPYLDPTSHQQQYCTQRLSRGMF